jgi:uncharacterized membrane protein YhaH (DUF805 family)
VTERPPAPAPVEEPRRNLPLLGALVLAGLEAVALVVAAVVAVVSTVQDRFVDAPVSIALVVVLLLFAGLLVLGVQALWHGRRWGRGPVATWQLLQAATALGAMGIAPPYVVYPAVVVALLVLVALLLPSSIAATSRPSSPSDTVL